MSEKTLEESLDEAEWSWIKPHATRDVVIVVAAWLDILEVGNAVATDSTAQIKEWIQKGYLGKPTAEQISAWDQVPTKRFLSLVVQPYVLIQDALVH